MIAPHCGSQEAFQAPIGCLGAARRDIALSGLETEPCRVGDPVGREARNRRRQTEGTARKPRLEPPTLPPRLVVRRVDHVGPAALRSDLGRAEYNVVEAIDDLVTTALNCSTHRGIATAGKRRNVFVEGEETRTGLIQELRQDRLSVALAYQERYAPLLEVSTQTT